MKRSLPLLASVFFALFGVQLHAQFTEVAQHPGSLHELRTLGSGTRLIDRMYFGQTAAGTRTIYNIDMSVHRVLTYPAPPAGMNWTSMWYITEALFDTDPSTIEFLLVAGTIGGPGDFAVFVFREDGTQLFMQDPGNIIGGSGGDYQGNDPVFMVGDQAYLILATSSVVGGPTRVYSLPGQLPCIDCQAAPSPANVTVGGVDRQGPVPGVLIYPNPAQTSVQVVFNTPLGAADAVVLVDAAGREVLRQPANGSTTETLFIAHLRAGRYIVAVERAGVRTVAGPFVVER